jgi:hypothetical protein
MPVDDKSDRWHPSFCGCAYSGKHGKIKRGTRRGWTIRLLWCVGGFWYHIVGFFVGVLSVADAIGEAFDEEGLAGLFMKY